MPKPQTSRSQNLRQMRSKLRKQEATRMSEIQRLAKEIKDEDEKHALESEIPELVEWAKQRRAYNED